MTLLSVLCRLALVGVLVAAAAGKLADRDGTRVAAAGLGVPRPLLGAAVWALSALELTTAALLLAPAPWAPVGFVLAVALLLAFSAAVARALRRGDAVACHCFGARSTGPADRGTLVRNGALTAAALLGLATSTRVVALPTELAALGAPTLAVLLLVVLGAAAALTPGWRPPAVDPPTAAPEPASDRATMFTLPDLAGTEVDLRDVVSDRLPALVVFIRPECGHCGDLLPELAAWQSGTDPVHVVVVTAGGLATNREKAAAAPGVQVLRQQGSWVEERYGITAVPAAVLVGADGTVLGEAVEGPDAIRRNYRAVRDGLLAQGHRRATKSAPA